MAANNVPMSAIDTIKAVLSRNGILKVVYLTSTSPPMGIYQRIYEHHGGVNDSSQLRTIRRHFYDSLNRLQLKNGDNTRTLKPPPPLPPRIVRSPYSIIKPYVKGEKVTFPEESRFNLLEIKEGQVLLADNSISSDSQLIDEIYLIASFASNSTFVIKMDNKTTYGEYLKLLSNYHLGVTKARDQTSQKKFSKDYNNLDSSSADAIRELVPMKLVDFSYSQLEMLTDGVKHK